jgi:hypothetical protein
VEQLLTVLFVSSIEMDAFSIVLSNDLHRCVIGGRPDKDRRESL